MSRRYEFETLLAILGLTALTTVAILALVNPRFDPSLILVATGAGVGFFGVAFMAYVIHDSFFAWQRSIRHLCDGLTGGCLGFVYYLNQAGPVNSWFWVINVALIIACAGYLQVRSRQLPVSK